MDHEIRLTEFSHGGGCGNKLASADLDVLLPASVDFGERLLVGSDTRDDAAIIDVGDGSCVVCTTDFSTPVVDDPFDFGRIAAANAISDIYAMGATPSLAVAIFGWPTKLLPLEMGQMVLEGGREVCREAGIPVGGGHSIDSPEPVFGLAVTGTIRAEHIKRNNSAKVGDAIYLTKPLGVGILTAAQKRRLLTKPHQDLLVESMCRLNRIGESLGRLEAVTAMTDVTGFGLAGHLAKVCEASGVRAVVEFDAIPVLPGVDQYLEHGCSPAGTQRNMDDLGAKCTVPNDLQRQVVFDPQTSGGLLVFVANRHEEEFLHVVNAVGTRPCEIGRVERSRSGPLVEFF